MIEEARGKCHDIVKGFPELDRDYDEFLSALRGTLREAGGSQV